MNATGSSGAILGRRRVPQLAAALAATGGARARAVDPIRIDVLVDMSGPCADYSGSTGVAAAQMAAAEAGDALGRPAGRNRGGRSPEQARPRVLHRPAMVRRGASRRSRT